ncbi:MAG: RNA 2'-phosphotransferase [Sphingobacteriales bacterium]|nr:MAG: RNA 2'-phosphotransferase [Sphingobacteriales bacterium]
MKSDKELRGISKYLSYVLRHHPESIDLVLDEQGWADIDVLLTKCAAKNVLFDREDLAQLVAQNDKQRFAIDTVGNKIRANQGHSIRIDAALEPQVPPLVLYHGTAKRFLPAILEQGLLKQNRLHVHLSHEIATARNVGSRHGVPVVLRIDTVAMQREGFIFYLSENKVWLTENVPAKYINYEQ